MGAVCDPGPWHLSCVLQCLIASTRWRRKPQHLSYWLKLALCSLESSVEETVKLPSHVIIQHNIHMLTGVAVNLVWNWIKQHSVSAELLKILFVSESGYYFSPILSFCIRLQKISSYPQMKIIFVNISVMPGGLEPFVYAKWTNSLYRF